MKDYKILKNSYYDSVTLMSTTVTLKKSLGFKDLVMFMGTDMNKDMIQSVGLYHQGLDAAEPNDLMLAVLLDEARPDWADLVVEQLSAKKTNHQDEKTVYQTLNQAVDAINPNIAIISVPGIYAAHEAYKAIEQGMHVMLFSDNVSVEDEIELKKLAIEKDVLVMGPDCGTAIINGKGLCFANQVSQGDIGLVAASGTGLQEVTVIIDRFEGGITQAIGVGGRDLSEKVGGLMMLKGIDALDHDPKTKVIVLISKPPHATVMEKLITRLKKITKPVVVCLLDAARDEAIKNVHFVSSLTDAALKALELTGKKTENLTDLDEGMLKMIQKEKSAYAPSQSKIKGLFCGGTLTAEALSILRPYAKGLTSNVAKKPEEIMKDPLKSKGHHLVDLGDDIFTQGKPHPMIEPTIRLDRILEEARLEETAVLLLDFELGLGSHPDPVGVTLETLVEAKRIATSQHRHLSIVAYVCGTHKDAQGLEKSEQQLRDLGVIVAKTNAHAAMIASKLIEGVRS